MGIRGRGGRKRKGGGWDKRKKGEFPTSSILL